MLEQGNDVGECFVEGQHVEVGGFHQPTGHAVQEGVRGFMGDHIVRQTGEDDPAGLEAGGVEGTRGKIAEQQGFFQRIVVPSGASAYIENSKVDIPPRQVEATARNIRLRSGPGSDSGVLRTVNLNGTYGVFDMRDRSGSGLWYQLDVNGTKGWVPAVAVRPRFSLPVVHFLAGLYRYQAKRYEDAAREFAQFINVPEVKADNVNLATALQLWGASEMLSKKTAFEVDRKVLERFDESIKQTPYDPAAYNLRALATIGVRQEVTPALRDLERALELDGHNEHARAPVRALTQIANPRTFSPFQEALEDLEEARQDLHRLRSRFAISVP